MPRQDVPYGGAICRLKERIAEIFDKLGEKLHTINGVPGDGDGNVKIISGSSAVVITNDPTQNEISVALDNSQLPAAAVSSVNGQTGAVALTADDIPSDNGDVQTDLDNLAAADVTLQGNINAEALARQNADNTLQTNINTVTASLPAAAAAAVATDPTVAQLVTADTQNVKLTGNQNISGVKTVPTEGLGGYSQQIANSLKIKNELDYYAPMVRLSDYQIIDGVKIFDGIPGAANTRNPTIDVTAPPANDIIVGQWVALDKNNTELVKIIGVIDPNGGTYANILVRNRDGTYKAARLLTSD